MIVHPSTHLASCIHSFSLTSIDSCIIHSLCDHVPVIIDFSMTTHSHLMIVTVHECTHRVLHMMLIPWIVAFIIFHSFVHSHHSSRPSFFHLSRLARHHRSFLIILNHQHAYSWYRCTCLHVHLICIMRVDDARSLGSARSDSVIILSFLLLLSQWFFNIRSRVTDT